MKTIDFTLYEIEIALAAYREVPRNMQEVANGIRDAFDVLYDKLMKALGRTMESIERAQHDRAVVNEAIETTAAAIDTLQAQADAPVPEGQQKPPPPKDLARAKKNLVKLKAIKNEIASTIKALEHQLYQQKLERDYLLEAYRKFQNTYNYHITVIHGIVWSAGCAAGHARSAMYALRAGSSARMECENPSYLRQAADHIITYSQNMQSRGKDLTKSTQSFRYEMTDNVSRKAEKEISHLHRAILRQADEVSSQAGRLRQAASYLDMYLCEAR